MMKKVTCGMCWLASAAIAAAVAYGQQAGGGSGTGQDAQQGQGAAQQQSLPGQQPGELGAGQNQLGQPGAPREQAGQLLLPQQPGVETRQNVITPGNRFGQQRGYNYQGGQPDPMPTPAERQAQGLDAGTQLNGQRGAMAAAGGQRGELGVWLAAGAGPGVEIRQVTGGSAAAEIGLQAGDMLLEINGRSVYSPIEVQQMIRSIPAGQTATLAVWRDGNQQEVSVTLQPARENYRSGYRGDAMSSRGGDLESRTMRLEEQLSMVMRELEQIRSEMARLHPESSSQPAGGGIGGEQPAAAAEASPFDASETPPEAAEPIAPATPPATPPEPTAPAAEQPTTEAEPAPAEQPATESAAAEEPAEDLFGGEAAEPEAATETPAEAPAETETETETESDTDSLFE
jgi:hypothetical protein